MSPNQGLDIFQAATKAGGYDWNTYDHEILSINLQELCMSQEEAVFSC